MSNNVMKNYQEESLDEDVDFFEESLHGERFQRSQQKEKLQKFRKKNPGAMKPRN